jgi:hypothetical protein
MRQPASAFFATFRRDLYERLEYSFGEDAAVVGVMTAGAGDFVQRAAAFAASLPYAREWRRQVLAFAAAVHPLNYLIRADWRGRAIGDVTLYCRFPLAIPQDQVQHALSDAGFDEWSGPDAWDLARLLGLDAPTGIALRIDGSGRSHAAVYYRVEMAAAEFFGRALRLLLARLSFGAESNAMLEYDFPRLHTGNVTGVVGIDGGTHAALKIDPANVPLPVALEFFRRRGASEQRVRQLAHVARSLAARRASYVGMKYDAAGFRGWKLYLSLMPCAMPNALAPVLDDNQPTLLLPPLRGRTRAA